MKDDQKRGFENIVARAYYMYQIRWVCQRQVSGWEYTFEKGQTYHIPYGQPVTAGGYIGFDISVDSFLNATKDPEDQFYLQSSYWDTTRIRSTFYASDCSAFVSYCWGVSRTVTSAWEKLNSTVLGSVSSLFDLNMLQPGDALNHAHDHIVLVTAVNNDGTVEIIHQTPPQLKREILTVSEITENYSQYSIYRYNDIARVPAPPVSVFA